ncbi:MAG: hypothetical protein ABFQ62_05325 [Patescibacteria group bacterium]
MQDFKIDKLSFYLGRFDLDCYLIARGVRFIGTHEFSLNNYKKLKLLLKKRVKEDGLEIVVQLADSAEVVIYHPTEGKIWLQKLQELDKKSEKCKNYPLASLIFEKIVKKQKLTKKEKLFLKKMNLEWKSLEDEYGRVFGYSESSIGRYLDKLNNLV